MDALGHRSCAYLPRVMADFQPAQHVDEQVRSRHGAHRDGGRDRRGGSGRPVYVAGLKRWEAELEGRPVEVSGTLRLHRGEEPDEDDELVHDVDPTTFVLEDASWSGG